MVQINIEQREITLKIVYYGPALSGKTTNLQAIHQLMESQGRGRLMVLDTADDRTLFFDLMPVFFKTQSGFTIKVKLFTVPGQVMHNSTRRIVLQGVDGIAFVADSQKSLTKANNDSWRDMTQNLRANGLDIKQIPVVIQFNKRDLPDVRSEEEIETVTRRGKEPIFMASAIKGVGVFETLEGILRLTWRLLNSTLQLEQKLHLCEDDFISNLLRRPKLAQPSGPEGVS
jgi:signal recognition particle receptor subunit beta